MTRLLIILLLVLATSLVAQEARVIELSRDDSARAKAAWDNLQKAQKEWDALQEEIKTYMLVKRGDPDASNLSTMIGGVGFGNATFSTCVLIGSSTSCLPPSEEEIRKQLEWDDAHLRYYRKGFTDGFEFTKDFRFIVPRKVVSVPNQYGTTTPYFPGVIVR